MLNRYKKIVGISILSLVIIWFVLFAHANGAKSLNDRQPASKELSVSTLSIEEVLEEPTEHIVETRSLISAPIEFSYLVYTEFFDIELSASYLETILAAVTTLETALSTDEYTEAAFTAMNIELARLQELAMQYQQDIDRYTLWEQEYYYATKTWELLRQQGFSDVVTSAILGNMMVETSGGTLSLNPKIYDSRGAYYGLCQWSLYYKPFINGKSFEEQLNYLIKDMPKEFETFGHCYKKGFTYEDFLNLDNIEHAALAFAKVYERCSSTSYWARGQAALKAYSYFVGS